MYFFNIILLLDCFFLEIFCVGISVLFLVFFIYFEIEGRIVSVKDFRMYWLDLLFILWKRLKYILFLSLDIKVREIVKSK